MTAPTTDVECPECGCAFTTVAAFDAHRPDGKCVNPTDCGLVVAPRVRLTWSVSVRVPVDVDAFGNVARWIDVDREIPGHWDDRCGATIRDRSTNTQVDRRVRPMLVDTGGVEFDALRHAQGREIRRVCMVLPIPAVLASP